MEKKSYSLAFRILHWSIAISFLLLLITIFLRLTWMNKNNMAAIIQDYLAENNSSLSHEQILILAKRIRQPMWQWHIYLGYILAGLYCIRLLLPLFGEMKFQNPFEKNITLKIKFKRFVYFIFYICFATSIITGLFIVFGPSNLKETMEDIHVLGIYYLVAFIAVHLSGVLIAECTDQKGIVSRIICDSETKK
ncbi:MAG: cytochrome b/b6 domain-containing protein [Bacteroidia bacterium]